MKSVFALMFVLFSAFAMAEDGPTPSSCQIIQGRGCPAYGVAYRGQKSSCYSTREEAREAMDEMTVCRSSGNFGECSILNYRAGSRCPNFAVIDEYAQVVCFQTAQGAYNGMMAGNRLSCYL